MTKAHEKYKHVNIQCKIYLLLLVFGRVEQDEKLKSVGYKLCCEVYPFLEVHKHNYTTTTCYKNVTRLVKLQLCARTVLQFKPYKIDDIASRSLQCVLSSMGAEDVLQRPSEEPKYVAASLHQLSAHTQVYSGI